MRAADTTEQKAFQIARPRRGGSDSPGIFVYLFAVAIAYGALRVTTIPLPPEDLWSGMLNGSAPRPFAYRVMSIWILQGLMGAFGWGISISMFVIEASSVFVALCVLLSLIRLYLPLKVSVIWTTFFVLALAAIQCWWYPTAYFYPYDTFGVALCLGGMLLASKEAFVILPVLVIVGTLNRESAVVIPLIGTALWWRQGGKLWKLIHLVIAWACFYYTRAFLELKFADNPAEPYHLYVVTTGELRFLANLSYLFSARGIALYMGSTGYLILLWCLFGRFVPPKLSVLRWPLFAWKSALLFVGNYYEPRIFGEFVAVAYVICVIAIHRWYVAGRPLLIFDARVPMALGFRGVARVLRMRSVSVIVLILIAAAMGIEMIEKRRGLASHPGGGWEGCITLNREGVWNIRKPAEMLELRVFIDGTEVIGQHIDNILEGYPRNSAVLVEGGDYRSVQLRPPSSANFYSLEQYTKPIGQASWIKCRNALYRITGVRFEAFDKWTFNKVKLPRRVPPRYRRKK